MPVLSAWHWINVKDYGYRLEMTLELYNPDTQDELIRFFVFKEVVEYHDSLKFLNSHHYNDLKDKVDNHARKLGYRWKNV